MSATAVILRYRRAQRKRVRTRRGGGGGGGGNGPTIRHRMNLNNFYNRNGL